MKIFITILWLILCAGEALAEEFTVKVAGTVSDNLTGLMWQQQDDKQLRTWQEAITYCEGLTLGIKNSSTQEQFTDWRLPNIKELISVVDINKYHPSISSLFTSVTTTAPQIWWSSTTYSVNTNNAWIVEFDQGSSGIGAKTTKYLVRCVRDGI